MKHQLDPERGAHLCLQLLGGGLWDPRISCLMCVCVCPGDLTAGQSDSVIYGRGSGSCHVSLDLQKRLETRRISPNLQEELETKALPPRQCKSPSKDSGHQRSWSIPGGNAPCVLSHIISGNELSPLSQGKRQIPRVRVWTLPHASLSLPDLNLDLFAVINQHCEHRCF